MKTFCIILMLLLPFAPVFAQQGQSSFNLQYQFQKGDQFQIKQHFQQDSYLNLNGVEQRTTNQQDAVLMLTVTDVNSLQATLEASYKEIRLISSSQNQNISVNTDSDGKDVFNRMFKAMTGKTFTIVMQYNGLIKSVSGLSPIFDDMIAAVPEVKAKERETLKKFLESQYGPEQVKENLSLVLPYYPDMAVSSNGSWTNQLYTNGLYNGHLVNQWKMTFGDKFSINLINTAKFTTDSTREVDLGGGQKGYVDLKGEVQGQYMVNPASGWPTICITHTELKGDYVYMNPSDDKRNVRVPVRVVKDASYQFKQF